MRIFTCTDHNLRYPVGCASVIVARGPKTAQKLLDKALIASGLSPFEDSPHTLTEISSEKAQAIVLQVGTY